LPKRAAVGDYRKVAAFLANFRDADRHREVALGQVLLDTAIEPLVLEVHDRIAVANRALQNSLRIVRRRGRDHLESRHPREPRLGILRMEQRAMDARARRRANHERTRGLAAVTVAQGSGSVDDL